MNKTFSELGTECLSPLWAAAPCRACHGSGLPQDYPGAPVQHQTTQRSHTHPWAMGGFKIPTPRARTSHTAFGGSPNHAHKRCNRYSQPANFGTKHLILWASLQHARWTWTLPLSFISTHTTWNRHTLKHKLWKLPDRNQDLMLWTYYGSTLFQAAHDFLTFKDALFWCSQKRKTAIYTNIYLIFHFQLPYIPLNIYIINNKKLF